MLREIDHLNFIKIDTIFWKHKSKITSNAEKNHLVFQNVIFGEKYDIITKLIAALSNSVKTPV